jgi:hypothetical protein
MRTEAIGLHSMIVIFQKSKLKEIPWKVHIHTS